MSTETFNGPVPCAARCRTGDWMMTASGRKFWPLDPSPAEVELTDIARSLAQQCRWTGHTAWHYSVAQHAVLVARVVERVAPDLALAALHHDSGEAYLADIARPVKRNLIVGPVQGVIGEAHSIGHVESRILSAIYWAFGIRQPSPDGEALIREADNRVLEVEHRVLMPNDEGGPWLHLGRPPKGITISKMEPDMARVMFLHEHDRLVKAAKAAA